MIARVTTLEGSPDEQRSAVQWFEDHVLPVTRERVGYRGILLLVERGSGKAVSISLWDSDDDERASEEGAGRLRAQAVDVMGGSTPPVVERYDVAVHDFP